MLAFGDFLRPWEADDDENNLLNWFAVAQFGRFDESNFRLITLGYVTGLWEQWTDTLGDRPLAMFDGIRKASERAWAEGDLPHELFDFFYGANILGLRLAEYAIPGDASLVARLNTLWEEFVLANTLFEAAPVGWDLVAMRGLYNSGIGLNLFVRWLTRMEERGVPDEERWDPLLQPTYDDRLFTLARIPREHWSAVL